MSRLAALCLTLTLATVARADDWPQWMGPTRDDVWKEAGVVEKLPEGGPKKVWSIPVEGGYSGPAVAGGKVFVMDYAKAGGKATNTPTGRDELTGQERVLCVDAESGKLLWKHAYDCKYKISYPAGPRCTPAVDGDRVYTLGAEGDLYCLDVAEGKPVWHKQLKTEYKIDAPLWGFAGHPLIDGDKLICLVGGPGSVAVAFDKKTGKELWKALSSKEPGYAPPSIITAGKTRQLIIFSATAVNSLDPETGKVYWSIPLEPKYGMSIARPVVEGNIMYASGIGEIGAAFKLDPDEPKAELLWTGKKDTALYSANSTPVVKDGVMYGTDCMVGVLRGVKLATGERLWESSLPTTGKEEKRAPHGTAFIVRNGETYYLFAEPGHLITAKLTPESYTETSRAFLIAPTQPVFGRDVVWSHPAFAMKSVFVRNDKELARFSLAK